MVCRSSSGWLKIARTGWQSAGEHHCSAWRFNVVRDLQIVVYHVHLYGFVIGLVQVRRKLTESNCLLNIIFLEQGSHVQVAPLALKNKKAGPMRPAFVSGFGMVSE